jgi:hypothetical protein
MTGVAAPRRQTCTAHCAGCNEHFHGLTAFDAHRRGDPDNRYCAAPEEATNKDGRLLLQAWTETGRN